MNKSILLIPIIVSLTLVGSISLADSLSLPIIYLDTDKAEYNHDESVTITIRVDGWFLDPTEKVTLKVAAYQSDTGLHKSFTKPQKGDTVIWVIPASQLAAATTTYQLEAQYSYVQSYLTFVH